MGSRQEKIWMLIAHAPKRPPSWFKPVTEPRPDPPKLISMDKHLKDLAWHLSYYGKLSPCQRESVSEEKLNLLIRYEEELFRYHKETIPEWEAMYERERELQWPLHWAIEQYDRCASYFMKEESPNMYYSNNKFA